MVSSKSQCFILFLLLLVSSHPQLFSFLLLSFSFPHFWHYKKHQSYTSVYYCFICLCTVRINIRNVSYSISACFFFCFSSFSFWICSSFACFFPFFRQFSVQPFPFLCVPVVVNHKKYIFDTRIQVNPGVSKYYKVASHNPAILLNT